MWNIILDPYRNFLDCGVSLKLHVIAMFQILGGLDGGYVGDGKLSAV